MEQSLQTGSQVARELATALVGMWNEALGYGDFLQRLQLEDQPKIKRAYRELTYNIMTSALFTLSGNADYEDVYQFLNRLAPVGNNEYASWMPTLEVSIRLSADLIPLEEEMTEAESLRAAELWSTRFWDHVVCYRPKELIEIAETWLFFLRYLQSMIIAITTSYDNSAEGHVTST